MNFQNLHRSAWKPSLGLAVLAILWQAATAQACSTPVYRYAMYNWPASPYRAFYFYRGEPAEEFQAINQSINELGEAMPAPANIFVDSINLDETEMDKLPQPIIEALESYEDGEPPHLVFTPRGVNVFSGRLDEATLKAMTESPARTRIGELLDEGNATVMLFVPGKDPKETTRVEKEIQELLRRGAAGEIPVEEFFAMPPMPAGPDGEGADEDAAVAGALKLATLKVERSDPAEKWLIRLLMTIEPDLNDLAEEPMVFAVYGRGRALEPYVGEGITADNLTEVVMFLGSACSCTVKGMNPGADLLLKWDWDATAERMAQNDPAFNMPPYGYGEYYYPDDVQDAEPSDDTELADDTEPAAEPEAVADASSAVAAAAAEEAVAPAPAQGSPPAEEPDQPAADDTAPSETQEAAQPGPPPAGEAPSDAAESGSFVTRQLWTYGIGLAVAAVVVLGAGFVLIRRQSGG